MSNLELESLFSWTQKNEILHHVPDNSLLTTTTVARRNFLDQLSKYIDPVCDIKQNTQVKLKVTIAYPDGDIN